jgi:hypothetical protein
VTAWLSAGAAVLTALVGAIALFARADDSGGARSEEAPRALNAPAPSSSARAARDVEIEVVRFLGPDLDGPAYEFRGEAVLASKDELQVIARPVGAGEADGGERWIASPAAKIRDGRWEARIGMPPLTGDSFDFAAVITPAPSRSTSTRVPARPLSVPCLDGSLSQKGVDACNVVESTPVQRHTG